ncbi:MAG: hypothetical protein ABW123_11375 [Cystobacter sp.]
MGNFKNSLLEESREEPERYRAPRELRLLTELGAGLVTATAGGAAGMLIGNGLCMRLGWDQQAALRCINSLIMGLILGASAGYGLGVWWGGEVVGGDGRLLFTMLGTAAGMVVTGALTTLRPTDALASTLLIVPIPLGSHLGYELSQRAEPSSSELSARPGFQPLLGFSSRGALLGLGGRF